MTLPSPPRIRALRCVLCSREYMPEEVAYSCPTDGSLGVLEVALDYDSVQWQLAGGTMWRYRCLLPIEPDTSEPAIAPCISPLLPVERLRAELGLRQLWIKDETRNPTASLKDRASSLCVAKARAAQASAVSCASTGNAAASWAAVAAAEGFPCHIFVPSAAPKAKIVQLLAFGAHVYAVDGSYDDAFELCIEASAEFGWYNRNTGFNPYTIEGKKTVALEIAEQLDWRAPDTVVVPVGDGCIISGVAKGFRDLLALGRISHMPRLIAAQAFGSDAIKRALDAGWRLPEPIQAQTIADSISVGLPRNGAMALRDIRASGGRAVAVSDEAILSAERTLGRLTGIFAEPAAAAAVAATIELASAGELDADESIVVLLTGSGLKAVEALGSPELPLVRSLADVRARL